MNQHGLLTETCRATWSGPAGAREFRVLAALPPGVAATRSALTELLQGEIAAALHQAGSRLEEVARATLFCDPAALREPEAELLEAVAQVFPVAARPACAAVRQPPLPDGGLRLELIAREGLVGPPATGGARPPVLRQGTGRGHLLTCGAWQRAYVSISIDPLLEHVTSDTPPLYRMGLQALEQAEQELTRLGLGFEHVVRTWFYIPELLRLAHGEQHYQQLNAARAAFFDHHPPLTALLPPDRRWTRGYPASTGIGVLDGPLVLELDALAGPPGQALAFPIENPHQVAAYEYPASVLVGERLTTAPPRFSRALVELQPGEVRVRISGTASIRGAATLHRGDVAAQTETTLATIAALISPDNLARHGLEGGRPRPRLTALRAYVKQAQDYPVVRALCETRCPGVPCLYVQADVCRDDLLVELEAEGVIPIRAGEAGG